MTSQKFKQTEIGKTISINPRRELKKGIISKKVSMDKLNPFNKKVQSYEITKFSGGSKFVNEDTLLARITPCLENGKTAYVDFLDEGEIGFGSTEFIVLSGKEGETTNEFVYYLAISPRFRDQAISSMTGTSGRQRVQTDFLEVKDIEIPPLPEQHAIAKILSSLDAKIELNNKMNKTLETIGQAIFKRGFIEGKKGEWKEGKLGEIGKIQPGFAFKSSDFVNEGYKLIKIRNIQNPVVDIIKVDDFLSKEIFNKIDKKIYLGSGDILIAMTGAELGKVGIIPRTKDRMLLNQRVGKVISENPFLFYFYITSPEMQGYFKGIASASSAQGNISNSDIEGIDMLVPDKDTINKFTSSTKKMFELWISNLQQNQTLSSIRDALLPKLMSGEIRVK